MSLQPVLHNTNIGHVLTLYRAATSIPSAKYLESLPPRNMYLAVYRLLYRLRFVARSNTDTYCTMLRRRIRDFDFSARRAAVLRLSNPLSQAEMAARLSNTIAFVFNATCAKEPHGDVVTYEDLVAAQDPRIEQSVVNTILTMELQTPLATRFDYDYAWMEKIRRDYEEASDSKKLQRLSKNGASQIGFLQYEAAVMALNETERMCL